MKCVIYGVLFGIITCSIFSVSGSQSNELPNNRHGQKRTPFPMYERVDTYEGCDVIRYTDKFGYVHYFSHCGIQKVS